MPIKMPHCVAFGCNFQSKGNKGSEISLHIFPKEQKLREVWEDVVGRIDLPKDPRLCSSHFSADAFEAFHRPQLMKELAGQPGYKRRLRRDAVPTVFPHKESKRLRVTSESRLKRLERWGASDMYLKNVGPAGEEVNTAKRPSNCLTSVSVQCSPIMCDASTQTEVCMSEEAVQWKANVHSPLLDHNYCSKRDIDVHDVDGNSEDLFSPTPGDSSARSQSDPDFANSSQFATARVFLVFEDQLKQLLGRCVKCGSLIAQEDIVEVQNEGSQLTLEFTCANSCRYRWQAQPTLSGTKGAGNLLLTASVFFSGIHFEKFERFCCNMNLKTISEDTYTALRKSFVFPTIKKTWINQRNAVLTDLKSQEVVLCGDGRRDSPGHSAKYCTYTFLDAQSSKVVDFEVVGVTQVSNSNTMELHGFKQALKAIEDNGVQVSTISTDRHPPIVKEMRMNNPEKVHEFDPWHVAKGVSKKLTAEAKRRGCEDLGAWIPSIINHLWWCALTCAEDAVLLKEKWVSVIHHVTNRHDWPGNRRYHCCAHEPLDEESQRDKLWLNPGTEAHRALVKIVTDKRLLKDMDQLTKCIHTTTLEVYHSMYHKYLPKKTHFGYDVMVHASMLAALEYNNNVNREQVRKRFFSGHILGRTISVICETYN
uniref:THAP-type domain-containing protein n=1 Tax=Neogobius melanostomus TaxID=47308 RepID=A0A8C6TKP9_9GOBI